MIKETETQKGVFILSRGSDPAEEISAESIQENSIPGKSYSPEVTVRFGFVAALIVLAIIGIISYRETNRLLETQQRLAQLHKIYSLLHDIEINLTQAQINTRLYQLTGQTDVRQAAVSAIGQVKSKTSLLAGETEGVTHLRDMSGQLNTQATEYITELSKALRGVRSTKNFHRLPPAFIQKDRQQMSRVHYAITVMQLDTTNRWELEADESEASAYRTFQVILFGGLSALLVVVGAIHLVDTDVKRRRIAESERSIALEALRRREELLQESKERFRGLIEDGSDVICLLNSSGAIEYLSPSSERVLEHRNNDVLGSDVFRFIHPAECDHAKSVFAHLVEVPGRIARLELRVSCKNGGWRHIEVAATNRMDRSGLCGIVVNARDITERKRIEAESERLLQDIKHSETRLRSVMSNANCILWEAMVQETLYKKEDGTEPPEHWIDFDRQTYPIWNFWLADEQTAHRWIPIARAPEESFQEAFNRARFPDSRDGLSIRALREDLPGYRGDFRCRMADGSVRWIREDVTLAHLPPESGGLRRWQMVGVLTDVTQSHQVAEERERLIYDLKRSEARLRNITARANCLLWEAVVTEEIPVSDGITLTDSDTIRNTDFNWEMEMIDEESALSRLPIAMLPGKSFTDAFYLARPEEDRAQADARSLAALQENQPGYQQTFRCNLADGSFRWIEEDVIIEPILTSSGNPLPPNVTRQWRVIGVCLDVTERKQNEAARESALAERENALRERANALTALRASEEALRGFFNSASLMMGILEFDRKRADISLIRHNAAVLRFYGILPETQEKGEAEWMPDLRHVPLQEYALWQENARKGLEISAPVRFEYPHVAQSGHYWLAATLCHIGTTETGKDRFAYIVDDITAQKQDAERMIALTRELQRSNQELQDFTSIASHDLQEPLRKIQTLGSLLQRRAKDELSTDTMGYVDRMLNASGRMQTLINDLLTVSQVTTSTKPFASVDLNKIAHGVIEDLEARVQRTNGQVEIMGTLPTFQADPIQMRQLLQNLIGNGLKYHREGVSPVVHVSGGTVIEEGVSRIRLTVADNGIGFESHHAERIFQMFERLEGRDRFEGTGIGLAICRKIVERHGGTIRAESEVGVGSTFTVLLPVRQAG